MDVCIVGLDFAKSVFQVHGTDAEGRVLIRRQLRRGEVGGKILHDRMLKP